MDNVPLIVLAVVFLLGFLLLSGQWVGMALATAGVVILLFMVGRGQVEMVGRLQFNMANSFVLACIPLFIFMGFIFIRTRLSDLVYKMATPLVSFIPGGLLHTNVVAGSIFGAMCGTSVAAAAGVSTIAIPQLRSRNYDKELSYGSLAAAGSMSMIIPPSLTFIIYGACVGESIGALFIAGVIPGVVMTGLFMIYIATRAKLNPGVAPKEVVELRQLLIGLVNILPILLTGFLVLASIYLGVATPTEAAGVGVAAALMISIAYRRLNWRVLKRTLVESAQLTCMVMLLVVGAQFFAMGLSMLRIPQAITAWLVDLPVDRLVILTLIMLLYIGLGTLMEGTAILLMTLPITYPVITNLGFGSIWFGVLIVVLMQVGVLTPPFAMDVFIVHKISGEKDIRYAYKGAIPFMLIMLVAAILLIAFPGMATWLPSQMIR